jgi:uncharacterized protein with PQ loop repeat
VLGLANIGCWLVAQSPQLYENWKNSSVEALSPAFLLMWLTGDITNLVGCVLTKQLPVQLYTGVYFCFMDLLLVLQYGYYYSKGAVVDPNASDLETVKPLLVEEKRSKRSKSGGRGGYGATSVNVVTIAVVLQLAFVAGVAASRGPGATRPCEYHAPISDTARTVGIVTAWLSGVLYLFARLPQIILNHRRKDVAGLSFPMFFFAVMANVFYGASILIRKPAFDHTFVLETLPFLVGSLCTLFFSAVIVGQFAMYRWYRAPVTVV